MQSTTLNSITAKLPNINNNLKGKWTERSFDPSSMQFYFRLKHGSTSVSASFSFMEMSHPMLRINTAKKLKAFRKGLRTCR